MKVNFESERAFWVLALIVFALFAGVSYFPVLFGKIPFPRDMVLQFPAWTGFPRSGVRQNYADIGDLIAYFYPARAFASRAIHEGTIPLWNPDFLAGAPFLANAQSALFYPLNFLYYVVSLPAAWAAGFVLRMFLAASFMALFLRSIGSTKAGAVFSGLVFASCGFMTAWQGQPMVDAAIWLPLICYAVQRLHYNGSAASVALAGVAFAMPVLAGHPETAAHLAMTGTAIAAVFWASAIKRRPALNSRFLLNFTAAGLLAAGLASIQMIPTLEWLGQIRFALDQRWPPLPLYQMMGLVSRDILRGPNSAGIFIPGSSAYVGMIGLLAASLAPLHKAGKQVLVLAAITAAALAIAYGIEPMPWLISHLPVIRGLKNDRMILVASFGIAALAGLGISALEERVSFSLRRRVMALCLLASAFLVAFLLVYNLRLHTEFRVEFMRRPSFSRSLLLLALVPLLWRLYGGLRGRAFPLLVCAMAAFDLATFGYGYTGFAYRSEIFPPAPAFDFLKKHADPARFRIMELGLPYPSNAHMLYGLASADGYEVRLSAQQRSFFSELRDNSSDGIVLPAARVLQSTDRRLDMLNVKYFVLTPYDPEFLKFFAAERFPLVFNNGYVAVFENKSVLPRAFAVPLRGLEVHTSADQQLERLRSASFNPESSAIVAALPARAADADQPSVRGALPFSSSVEVMESHINDAAFSTRTSEAAVLVVSQTYFPGWKASVDGAEADVFPVNIALTGIALPAGAHEVRLVFRPLSFKIGVALTVLSTILLAGMILRSRTASVKQTR